MTLGHRDTSNSGAARAATPATSGDGEAMTFKVLVRLDTPQEVNYYCHGGILHYVIRQLLAE